MFKTYEELIEKFPVGTVYRRSEVRYKNHYYNLDDIHYYQTVYDKVIIIDEENCWCIGHNDYKVDGYLFNGTNWYPAKRTWEGWEPISEDEIEIGGF